MSDRDTFGPRLQRERERRGISLQSLAASTKVGTDLWAAMERNDFSRWPTGIFARAFVRDYARHVGLDADEVVNEFCRLFPNGDRRASRVLAAQGELIGHRTELDDPAVVPPAGERRAEVFERRSADRKRHMQAAPRAIAAFIDATLTASLAAVGSLLGLSFWGTLGFVSLVYFAASTVALATTPGTRLVALSTHLTFPSHWLALRRRSARPT